MPYVRLWHPVPASESCGVRLVLLFSFWVLFFTDLRWWFRQMLEFCSQQNQHWRNSPSSVICLTLEIILSLIYAYAANHEFQQLDIRPFAQHREPYCSPVMCTFPCSHNFFGCKQIIEIVSKAPAFYLHDVHLEIKQWSIPLCSKEHVPGDANVLSGYQVTRVALSSILPDIYVETTSQIKIPSNTVKR